MGATTVIAADISPETIRYRCFLTTATCPQELMANPICNELFRVFAVYTQLPPISSIFSPARRKLATGKPSPASPENSIAATRNNIATGQSNIATTQNSIAIGQNNTAIGQNSIAINHRNTVSGHLNTAMIRCKPVLNRRKTAFADSIQIRKLVCYMSFSIKKSILGCVFIFAAAIPGCLQVVGNLAAPRRQVWLGLRHRQVSGGGIMHSLKICL